MSYRLRVTVGALALAIALGACGDEENGSSGSAAGDGTPSGSAELGEAAGIYSEFTGGTEGKADSSKSPVVIGYVNDEGGIPDFPEGSVAAKAAAEFINAHLGGVGGHPVELSLCLVAGNEEQGQGCAQEFLGDKRIKVIVEVSQVVGAQSFHQTLSGKLPVVIGSPNSVADATAKNAYGISAGVFGTSPGFVSYATQFAKAKTASLLFPADDPTGQAAAKQIKGDLSKAGIKVTDVGYKSSAPDMLPSVIASGATKTDVTVTLFPSPPTCIAGGKALEQANVTKPILALNLCIAAPVKDALGDYPKWTYVSLNTNPDVPGDAPTDAYVQVMKAYAPENANLGGFAPHAFMATLAAVRALNAAGGADATSDAIAQELKSYTGPTPMFAPDVKYGSIPPLPTIPSLQTRLYAYEGDGKWTDVTDGEWVQPAH